MNPPPPMLPASGCTTARVKPTATAASTALPPCRSTSRPTSLAMPLPETTMACAPSVTCARPVKDQSAATPVVGPGVPDAAG
jgi:hypothetical protein